jgi:hypothetical protein
MTTLEMLKNWKFWYIFSMSFCLFLYTLYLLNTFKDIAMKHIKDDYFLTAVGALSFVIGTFGRFFYGMLLDLYPWKQVIGSALVLQIICAFVMEASFVNKYLYAVVFIIASFTGTAMFTGSMMITDKTFPKDRWIFSYVNSALIFNIIAVYIFRNYFTPIAGEFYTSVLVSVFLIIGLLQVIFHFETTEYQKLA